MVNSEDSRVFVERSHAVGAKALLSIRDGEMGVFEQCIAGPNLQKFVASIARYADRYDYDGIDLDWEHRPIPSQYDVLIEELHRFRPNYILTLAVARREAFVQPAQNRNVAHVNLMCYDRDAGNTTARFNSTLITTAVERGCDSDLEWLAAAGVPRSKLGLGLPFYGRKYLGATDPWQRGDFTSGRKSTVLFSELITNPAVWQERYKVWDPNLRAQYLRIDSESEKKFISYTGPEQIRSGVHLVANGGYGGIMVFALQYEYVGKATGDSRYPLTSALREAIREVSDTR